MECTEVVREMIERAFNQGDLSAVDELLASQAVDHQEGPDAHFRTHLKEVIAMLRAAFPDLHFEIQHLMSQADIVAMNSVMTGTHLGPFRGLAPTGRQVSVRHMHFVRVENDQGQDLWHLWDLPGLMRQLGAGVGQPPTPA